MTKLSSVEGIGHKFSINLQNAGITSLENLLNKGCTQKGRKIISDETKISEKFILEWVNRADLSRVKGVGSQYADLLENSAVDTVPALAQRNPSNLQQKMVEVNKQRNLVRQSPSTSQVQDWVAQAKALPRIITY